VGSNTSKNGETIEEDGSEVQTGLQPNLARRRFSRTALASSAVLLSLGNRSAWGQTVVDCMSVATLDSFNPATGFFASVPGGRPEHNETLAAEIHYVSAPDDGKWIATGTGTDGITTYATRYDKDNKDSICLVAMPTRPQRPQ
jgi:hypothetical protein